MKSERINLEKRWIEDAGGVGGQYRPLVGAATAKQYAGKLIVMLALAALVAAYVTGVMTRRDRSSDRLAAAFPGLELQRLDQAKHLYALVKDGQNLYYLSTGTQKGYGGPLTAGVLVTPDGRIKSVIALDHMETPSFFNQLMKGGFFKQFEKKDSAGALQLSQDIDTVSGATISSRAFTNAVRVGAHRLAENIFSRPVPPERTKFQVGWQEAFLLLLMITIVVMRLKKLSRYRLVVLGISMIFLGFVANRPLSFSHFSSLLLGFTPSILEQPFWWILFAGTVVMTIGLSTNLYCYWMCPFGAMQEFISRFGGLHLKLSLRMQAILKTAIYLFMWLALMSSFLHSTPVAAAYEPFATFFSLKGIAIQWYLVSLAVIGSFFTPRFWCRSFCPVGATLNLIARMRKTLLKFPVLLKGDRYSGGRHTDQGLTPHAESKFFGFNAKDKMVGVIAVCIYVLISIYIYQIINPANMTTTTFVEHQTSEEAVEETQSIEELLLNGR